MRVRALLSLFCALVVVLAMACASDSGSKKKKRKKLPPPPSSEELQRDSADSHFEEVRHNAASQLECPYEQVLVQCTRRDRDNNCIAIKASGCERVLEYDFGNE